MKKIIAFLLSVVCVFSVFASCGSNEQTSNGERTFNYVEDITAPKLLGALSAAAKPEAEMITAFPGDTVYDMTYEECFEELFFFDLSLTSDSAISFSSVGKFSDEIDAFVLKDEKDAEELKEALKKRASARAAQYRGYYEKQSEKAAAALILQKGVYVAFVISDNNGAAEAAFNSLFS